MERLAKQDAERRENKPKPTVDDFILDRGLQVWNDAVGKYMKLGRAVSRRERVETENDEEWDQSLTYSATPYEVIASAILRIRRWEWARSESVIQSISPPPLSSNPAPPRSIPPPRSYYGNPEITSVGEIRERGGMLQASFSAESSPEEDVGGGGREEKVTEPASAETTSLSRAIGKGGVFYDLGCGVGGVVAAAASVHCWDEVVGIECLEGLHNTALEVQQMWEKVEVTKALGEEYERGTGEGLNKLRFVKGNIFDLEECDWTVGDVIFCNCAMFTEERMAELQSAALGMRPGSFLFTVTKTLDEKTSDFALVEERMVKMDYGDGTVFMWVRTAEEASLEGGESIGAVDEVGDEEGF